MAYCALLLIAFISSLVRLCQKNKCCLAASLYFFFSAIAGGLFDLVLVFCNLQSLEMSDSFDDNLKHDVEEAYESVKDTRVVLVVSTLFAFLCLYQALFLILFYCVKYIKKIMKNWCKIIIL